MKGMRPLTDDEIAQVAEAFDGTYALRDRALFILGIKTGLRISEILSLTIGDVLTDERFHDRVYIERRHIKGKREGRSIPLNPIAKGALLPWIKSLRAGGSTQGTFIFKSRNGGNRAISRVQAWKILDSVFRRVGALGRLGTHTMRKSFAQRAFRKLDNDLLRTQKALGHRSISSTISYLSFETQEIDEVILSL